MKLLMNLTTDIKKVVVILAVLSLAVCISTAASARALDFLPWTYVDDGIARTLTLTDLTGSGTATLGGIYTGTALASQPKFTYGTFSGYGICIDWKKQLARTDPNYQVYSWTSALNATDKIGAIDINNKELVWNKLTTMWTTAVVNNEIDRAALQVATWKICNDGLTISGLVPAVQTQYDIYLTLATNNSSY